MSHDILGSSTSVDTQTNEDQVACSDARVPVEVVISGQSDPDSPTPPSIEMAVETVVEGESVDPADIEPSQEMEMLLGVSAKSKKKKAKAEAAALALTQAESNKEAESKIEKPAAKLKPVKKPKVAKEEVSTAHVSPEANKVESASDVSKEVTPKTAASKKATSEKSVPTPEVISTPEVESIEAVSAFEEMGLSPEVLKAIVSSGYDTPSPIQQETVPYILSGRDLIGQAETGSGKTAAFAWPLLSKVDIKLARPQILVLAPTRELAIQVTAAFEKYASGMKGFRAVTIYGGQSYETQFRAIQRGVHVVVGTPF